jgi:hypothetical protein
LVPGPPRLPIIICPGVGGGAGLTEATSNVGPSTPCAKAVAQHARTASPQPEILRIIFVKTSTDRCLAW